MKITIDGRTVECRSGATLLEAARGAGIAIPSLCEHRDLEPFAGCRICLVDVAGRKDFAPACATPAEEGLVVRTRTPEILALRKKILEFILAEHPYACLVCAEKSTCDDLKATIRKVGEVTGCVLCPGNGSCELQKVAGEVGLDKVELPAAYRNQEVRREDPFFDRDYNLCILCGRCIRVCEEIRGASVLSFIHRGGRTQVGTAFDRPLLDSGCRFCGACVDVCPTAALVERAARPEARPDRSAEIICPFCGQGCVLELGIGNDRVLFARPADAPPNHGQACVKGRFLVRAALSGPGRILEPHVRKDGRLVAATLEQALDAAAAGLQAAPEGRHALIYPAQASLEDAYAFLEFGREVMRAGAVAAAPAATIWAALDALSAERGIRIPATYDLAAIEDSKAILAWDVDLPSDHPIAWLRVVRAVRRGARLVAAGKVPAGPIERTAVALDLDAGAEALRGALSPDGPAVVLFDAGAVAGLSGLEMLARLSKLAGSLKARLVPLGRGGNDRGVHELESALGRPSGHDLGGVWTGLADGGYDALFLAGPAPDLETKRPRFLVCQDTHWSRNAERADVVLPAAAFAEAGGTWVNTEGRVRTYAPAVPSPGGARPDRTILAEIARRMGRPILAGPDAPAILREIRGRVPALAGYDPEKAREQPFFLGERGPGEARSRPAARPLAAEPEFSGDILRGYDPVARSRAFAKMRRVR